MNMTFKKVIGQVHLWLGLLAGAVVLVSMLAAAVFVWEEELTDLYYRDLVFADAVRPEQLPLSQLWENAQAALPGRELGGVEIQHDRARNFVFSSYRKAETPGFSWMSGLEYMDLVYVNPYTGQVAGMVDKRYDWIFMTRMLHQCLLLRQEVGHLVVGVATLIVLALALTGLVLWWPRNKAALRQRFTVKWNARWRRVNYDVHNVGGFYTHLFMILFAVTGLVWTFKWWTNGIYRILGNDPATVFAKHAPPVLTGQQDPSAIDLAYMDLQARKPNWASLYLDRPGQEEEEGEISAFVRYNEGSGWDESDSYYYHPETGELHWARTHAQKLLGEKWRNSNYAIHVGSIYGLPTKLLACFVTLFCASLPVSGFLVWWGRRKKKKKPSPSGNNHLRAQSRRMFCLPSPEARSSISPLGHGSGVEVEQVQAAAQSQLRLPVALQEERAITRQR
jgi:uncharacterized iron-regulated membrane protein